MATKELAKTLLTNEEVAKNFLIVNEQLDKYEAISKSVEVIDEESLVIAENNIADIKSLITRTKAAHKIVKGPYYQTGKQIDEYAKAILDRLEAFCSRMALPITNWRSVQEAHARAELEAKQRVLAKQAVEQAVEVAKLSRLTRTVYAKLHGGTFFTKEGEEKIASGCKTEEECAMLAQVIKEKFPEEDQFPFFPLKRNQAVEKISKDIRKHTVSIMESKSLTPGIVKEAKRRMREAAKEAGMEALKIEEALGKKISLENRKAVREGEKEIKEAASNTRKLLKLKITNEELVTREFLSVDEAKIRSWMEGKNDQIKKMLEQGKQPLTGVEFYVETTYVTK